MLQFPWESKETNMSLDSGRWVESESWKKQKAGREDGWACKEVLHLWKGNASGRDWMTTMPSADNVFEGQGKLEIYLGWPRDEPEWRLLKWKLGAIKRFELNKYLFFHFSKKHLEKCSINHVKTIIS
jgi:hypothetical protein